MAQLGFTANTDDLPEGGGNFDPIPAGWYTAKVADAELRDTKSGTGQLIAVRHDVLGPSYEGRVVWTNINIKNANPKAEEIGRQQLGDMMRAIGLGSVQDTDQLIGGECQIKVGIEKSEEYGDKNNVKGWKALENAIPPTGGGSSAPAAAQPNGGGQSAGGSGKPPWAK